MSKNTGTSELINYFTLGVNGDVGIGGNLTLSTIVNATVDTDRFLVSDSGVIKYRTGAELLSDIGAAPATGGSYLPLAGGTLTGPLNGTSANFSQDSTFHGVTIGRGGGGSSQSFAYNTAIGSGALAANTTGIFNTAIGFNALTNHTTGNSQIAVGLNAGRYINAGTANITSATSIYLGVDTRASANGNTNEIVIGHEGRGNGSNTVTIGNDSITSNIFSGNLSTRRAVGTASEGIIELRPNTGSSNIIIASGAVPLHILSTSGSLGLGVGNTPQVTIASGGAVTLTGSLSGTSAVFSGNLGIGITPSAWNTAYKAIQFGTTGALFGESGDAANYFTTNTFVDSVGFKYITSDWALGYFQENGVHSWRNAPSGTAGNAISFTQAMTLFSTGNLLVGSPSPISDNGARLQVSGTSTISAASTDYALTLQNIQDDSQGLLIRSTDNDGGLYLIRAQSSNSSVSQTWVDRFTLAKNGAATFSSSVTMAYGGNPRLTLQDTDAGSGNVGILFKEGTNDRWALASVGGAFQFFNETTSSNAIFITSGNNVGIGTPSPSTLLHVNGTTTQITLQNVDGGTNAERIGMFMTSGDIFKILSLNDNNTTRVDNIITANVLSGNVGIGTPSPASLLSVHGQFRVNTTNGDGNENRLFFNPGGAADPAQLYLYNEAQSNTIYITANGASYFNSGNVLIGTTTDNGSRFQVTGANSGSLPLVNLIASGTGTFQRGVRLLNSGMNAGDHIMMSVGQADSARNMGQMYFQYNGSGSTSNRLSFGLHSVDDVLNIFGTGNVGIGTVSDNGQKFRVNGNMQIDGFQKMYTYYIIVQPNTTGTVTISSPTGTNMQGSMQVIAGGYGNSLSGNVTGLWMVGGLLFFNNASTSTITQIVNSVTANGSMSFQRSSDQYTVTLANTSSLYAKTLFVSVIINGD